MYTINWRGDKCKNFYNTRNKVIAFCDHITAGSRQSVYYWFNSPNNNAGSSHYVIARDGSIDQYVKIEKSAWTQGIASDAYDRAESPIVRDNKGINPNYYMIGIEYEGYVEGHLENGEVVLENFGLDGSITEEQFYAGCWLKKYLQGEVEMKWGNHIPLIRYNLEQHRRIDPKRKPFCPGDNFPVERQLTELAIADKMSLEAYEERLNYLQNPSAKTVRAFKIADRMDSWFTRQNDAKWGELCKVKMLMFAPLLNLNTIEEIHKRICKDLYVKALGKSFSEEVTNEAIRKLMECADFAEERGVL